MDSPPLPVPVGSPPCTIKSYTQMEKKKPNTKMIKQYQKKIRKHNNLRAHLGTSNLFPNQMSPKKDEEKKNLNDSVKLDIIIVASSSKLYEIPASSWSLLVIHLNKLKISTLSSLSKNPTSKLTKEKEKGEE